MLPLLALGPGLCGWFDLLHLTDTHQQTLSSCFPPVLFVRAQSFMPRSAMAGIGLTNMFTHSKCNVANCSCGELRLRLPAGAVCIPYSIATNSPTWSESSSAIVYHSCRRTVISPASAAGQHYVKHSQSYGNCQRICVFQAGAGKMLHTPYSAQCKALLY